jgi:hypothetical protein
MTRLQTAVVLILLAGFADEASPNPVPVDKLRVVANPASVIIDGRSAVHLTVMLLDAGDRPALPPHGGYDIQVFSSLGDLRDTRLEVEEDESFAQTTLTSYRHGQATVTASAPGLDTSEPVTVQFLFPWLMLGAATLGGFLGSFVRSRMSSVRRRWRVIVASNLAVGCVVGVMFYLAVLFGAVGAMSYLPVDVTQVPAVNELGALLLGFIGGYYGTRILDAAASLG